MLPFVGHVTPIPVITVGAHACIPAPPNATFRWMVEAARANDELSSTRKALLDIQCNIAVVQKAMQQDQQDQEQAARAEELEEKVEEAGQKLAHALLKQEQVGLAVGM